MDRMQEDAPRPDAMEADGAGALKPTTARSVPEGLTLDEMLTNTASCILSECRKRGWKLCCAESLTGGLLADSFVTIPGASAVFLGSAVTYYLGAKAHLLGVDPDILSSVGAVDPRVARQMASGACQLYGESLAYDADPSDPVLALSTTGVAGPTSDGFQPVGRVYVGVCSPDGQTTARMFTFSGGRLAVRRQAVLGALQLGLEVVERGTASERF